LSKKNGSNVETMEGTLIGYANGNVQRKQGNQIGVIIAFKRFDYENRID
jgi:hypothetical protein